MLPLTGILNTDKPAGPSSARVVAQVKRLLPKGTKIGHAGTLDPFATGVLLLLVGKATKSCEQLMNAPKQYEATIKLGATTDTDDPESPEHPTPGVCPPTPAAVVATLPRFVGDILQRPPAFSAMKVEGKRSYHLARKGQLVQHEPRVVRVYSIELLDYEWPLLRIRVDCGRGTYIRALARDIGEELKVGGHLVQLRRTRVGDFSVETAVGIDALAAEGVAKHLQTVPPFASAPSPL